MDSVVREWGKYIGGFIAICVVCLLVSVGINTIISVTTDKEECYCEVLDKNTRVISTGKSVIYKYEVCVKYDDDSQNVTVPVSIYNDVEIGNDIKCLAYTKKGRLVKIDIV